MKKIILFSVMLLFGLNVMFSQDVIPFYLTKTMTGDFEKVTDKVKVALKDQGFGVITEIDMDKKINEKVDHANMRPYKILGVCNPGYAFETLQIEENIGVFLPCKALVKDIGDGKIEVVIVNPAALMGMLGKEELVDVAIKVEEKFKLALDKI